MEIRIRATGAVMFENEFRAQFPLKTLPAVITPAQLGELDADPVLAAPAPALERFQRAVRSGVKQDALGNWVYAYTVGNWGADEIAVFFASTKADKLAATNDQCEARMSALVTGYPEHEQKSFSKQEGEARAFTANPDAATPLLDALAATRGIAKIELVARVIAKADAMASYSGLVIGYRQKLEDQIMAATTQAELDAINPASGWPL